MRKVAFLTTIFPMEKLYLVEFFDSLQNQTNSEFDLIVVNDGYKNFSKIKSLYSSLNIIELKYSSTPAKNREHGINYVLKNNYDALIFGDSDDYFDKNRVQVSLDGLRESDIVVNDISLFNAKGVYARSYLSNRVENQSFITLDFIKNKNIFGLSNTALNTGILEKVSFETNLVAVDWFFYSVLLLKKNRALFTNQTQTFYRQYENNTIGLGNSSFELFCRMREVKFKHYQLLSSIYSLFNKLYEDEKRFKKNNNNFLAMNCVKFPLWWEE